MLPSKIIHLVPPLPQVQVRQDYLDHSPDMLPEFPSIFLLLPPGGSPNHPLGEFLVLQHSIIFHNKLVKPFLFPEGISACGSKQLEK
ncbi:hypothetical protein ILYODFUR_034438 [Ilyodon furcidens]|uniref:Uncharacterized protein n=1 Tax=Ilyodon furcidens TaxID=33524 RepID=A0ABV0TPL2_9TELE